MRNLILSLTLLFVLLPAAGAMAQEPDAWDFVPGEKLLVYDDFTDMPKGGAPPHWKVRGGAVRLVEGRLTLPPGQEVKMWPNITKWPKNFTIEMEIQSKPFEDPTTPGQTFDWSFNAADGNWIWHVVLDVNALGGCGVMIEVADPQESQRAECKFLPTGSNKYAVWAQDGRVRVYMNGQRIMDINQVKTDFQNAWLRADGGALPVSYGPFRIAQSAPDISKTLLASGRYVTHGILFDLNSDKLRPESKPVLQQIAEALKAQGSLKVRIEGHTDSTGDAAANLDLSKRRAQSVKSALVSQFGIAGDRLTTDGFGTTKPVSPNDTPQGRADNRRVEFVKL